MKTMYNPALLLLLACALRAALAAPAPAQEPLALARPRRKLHGRFLHITDIHPDPFYAPGTSEKSACHRKKPKKARPRAGLYGMPYSECDSPLSLTNLTLDYIDKEWADEVDFVVWTGDSARHDNDRKQPRTLKEIYQLNRAMARRMEEIFVKRGVPVIPSIGNNDVWPHNIMMPGPNEVTFEFSSIWKSFVPFHSYQVFQRGAYFAVEVVPDALAVVSLNTMYFYDANKAVGGCAPDDPADPGTLQLDWLGVQLGAFRGRGMQVWLTGHVPPSADNYHSACHARYVELALQYQDTVLGHLYGHMNADHFFFLDAKAVRSGGADGPAELGARDGEDAVEDVVEDDVVEDRDFEEDDADEEEEDEDDEDEYADAEGQAEDDESPYVEASAEDSSPRAAPAPQGKHKTLYASLLKAFGALQKADERRLDGLAAVNVGPSVVPMYLPSFRVFAYNVTGRGEGKKLASGGEGGVEEGQGEGEVKVGEGGSDARRDAPSRTNRQWTPLGFAQYYMPEMEGRGKHAPGYALEYLTFVPARLHPPPTGASDGGAPVAAAGSHLDDDADEAASKFVYPIPLRHLPKSLRNATRTTSKYAPYGMEDLTVGSWAGLARSLAEGKEKKLRQRFRRYMYMGLGERL